MFWSVPNITNYLIQWSVQCVRTDVLCTILWIFFSALQVKAREAGLWNLFLPAVSGLSQLDYAYIAEETGRCLFAPEVFNCQAPGKTTYLVS